MSLRGFAVTEKDDMNMGEQGKDEGGVKVDESAGSTAENAASKGQEIRDANPENQAKKSSEAPAAVEPQNPANWNIDLLLDVELPVRVSFGQTEMQLRDVFKLGAGSVIELDKSVNDPVTVIVNNKPIAKGEVVMVDGNYGVRILEVESTADRIRSLG
jgi:flagellar motor switch protein FliN/FliY